MFPYQDPSKSIPERVEDLLSRMTLEEKFAQMRLLYITPQQAHQVPFDLSLLENNPHCMGSTYNSESIPHESIRAIQDWVRTNTRLGIPMAVHGEALHGNMHKEATVFPQSIGLGSTFNTDLMRRIAEVIGVETRANGISLVYAPNVDLSRDPRWGRTEENYGEDPYLTAQLGATYVKGIQSKGVAACPKHFALYGSPEGGINLAPPHVGEREAWENMLIPFQKVVEAGAMGIMPSYGEWDGIPAHGSHKLLTEILRDKWGFTGQVVTDYGALSMFRDFHKTAATYTEAGKMALAAGVDVEAPMPDTFTPELEQAVRNGEISEELVDQAVRRILRHKFEMGLFEDPYPHSDVPMRTPEALALSRQAANESIVLLKNEGNLLPLSDTIGSVALIGPNADNVQLGDYTASEAAKRSITLRRGLEERLGAQRVHFAKGCGIATGSEELQQHAVTAAAQADVAIVVLGDNSNYYAGIGWGDPEEDGSYAVTCGEGFDVHSMDLPSCQQALLEAVFAVGKPVILVMETGRPYAICWAKEHIPAILQAWYPGELGGYALTDILFGDVNPSGRLPISFPRSTGHIPAFYNHKTSARGYYKDPGTPEKPGRDYVFDTPDALFTFGEGLSYTTFAYSSLQVQLTGATDADVTVTVTNTGDRAGFEVVQLYITDSFCRVTPFVRRLRGFDKIWLEPGQSQRVQFRLGFEDFAFVNDRMELEVEPGEFIIRIADQSVSIDLP